MEILFLFSLVGWVHGRGNFNIHIVTFLPPNKKVLKYSQTCVQRPLLGPPNTSVVAKVVVNQRSSYKIINLFGWLGFRLAIFDRCCQVVIAQNQLFKLI